MSPGENSGISPTLSARSAALLAGALGSLRVERANGYESLVLGKIDLLRSFDVPAMNDVVAICYWGRSGSRLLTSFLDGHDHAAMLPMEKSQRIYEFLAVHPDLSLRDKLLGYPAYIESYTPLFHGEFPIAASHYYAAIDALLGVYGGRPPEFLSASRTFFQFLHVAYELALGRRPAVPRPLIVYAQHRLNYHTARLVKDFPEVRFLHTVRDPISNFDSMFAFYLKNAIEKRQVAHSSYPEAAMRSLIELVGTDCANRGMEARTRAVRFEDLHVHTEHTMRKVADWIGLPYRPSLLESSFNGTPWVVAGRGGAAWSGARPEQVKRQSPNMWLVDRWLVYALFHEDFIAWNYPCPSGFRRPALRRLAAAALRLIPTKIELLNAAEALKRKVIPSLRSGRIGPAFRTLTGLVAHHFELMKCVRAELQARLSGVRVALQPLEIGIRGAGSDQSGRSATQQSGGAATPPNSLLACSAKMRWVRQNPLSPNSRARSATSGTSIDAGAASSEQCRCDGRTKCGRFDGPSAARKVALVAIAGISRIEKRTLQIVVATGSLVPLGAGAAGILLGLRMLGSGTVGSDDLDSHFRYLSGLLLAIGIGYASTVPRIETQGGRFRLLTGIVMLGGIGRLVSLLSIGPPSPAMEAALVMELLVTPGLALWQHRVACRTK